MISTISALSTHIAALAVHQMLLQERQASLEARQTGLEASQDKARDAWRELRTNLRELLTRVQAIETKQEGTITKAQRGYIYQLVMRWSEAEAERRQISVGAARAACWGTLKAKFKLSRYEDLPLAKYAECVIFIKQAYTAITAASLIFLNNRCWSWSNGHEAELLRCSIWLAFGTRSPGGWAYLAGTCGADWLACFDATQLRERPTATEGCTACRACSRAKPIAGGVPVRLG
jgi:hypothetical protein